MAMRMRARELVQQVPLQELREQEAQRGGWKPPTNGQGCPRPCWAEGGGVGRGRPVTSVRCLP
eukprot:15259609-Alexandrium_andersonii.AAC.1